MDTLYAYIATSSDCNFSFIVGVARSQTKRSSSKAKCAIGLGGRVELIKYTAKVS